MNTHELNKSLFGARRVVGMFPQTQEQALERAIDPEAASERARLAWESRKRAAPKGAPDAPKEPAPKEPAPKAEAPAEADPVKEFDSKAKAITSELAALAKKMRAQGQGGEVDYEGNPSFVRRVNERPVSYISVGFYQHNPQIWRDRPSMVFFSVNGEKFDRYSSMEDAVAALPKLEEKLGPKAAKMSPADGHPDGEAIFARVRAALGEPTNVSSDVSYNNKGEVNLVKRWEWEVGKK